MKNKNKSQIVSYVLAITLLLATAGCGCWCADPFGCSSSYSAQTPVLAEPVDQNADRE